MVGIPDYQTYGEPRGQDASGTSRSDVPEEFFVNATGNAATLRQGAASRLLLLKPLKAGPIRVQLLSDGRERVRGWMAAVVCVCL